MIALSIADTTSALPKKEIIEERSRQRIRLEGMGYKDDSIQLSKWAFSLKREPFLMSSSLVSVQKSRSSAVKTETGKSGKGHSVSRIVRILCKIASGDLIEPGIEKNRLAVLLYVLLEISFATFTVEDIERKEMTILHYNDVFRIWEELQRVALFSKTDLLPI
jgi:hypothetical protein